MSSALQTFLQGLRQTPRWCRRMSHTLIRGHELTFFPARKQVMSFGRDDFQADLRAGFNVALLAFPQGMAYALIAGLPIQFGLMCFIGASLVAPFFASSRFNSYGPSNATSVLILSSFLALQLTAAQMVVAAPVIVLMAGLFLMLGAYMKVARLIQYVSRTVITGYITAAALLIIANQVRNALGYSIEPSASFFGVVYSTILGLPFIHWPSLALSLITVLVYLLLNRYLRSFPTVAICLLVLTGVAYFMGSFGWTVETLQSVELGDWRFGNIHWSMSLFSQMASASLALALLVTLESNSIGKSLAAQSGDRMQPNQEMFALGAANVSSSFFGGMAASASLTRSTLNYNSGGVSPMSSFYAALIVAVLLVGLGGFIGYIPKPALAVVVITIGISLIKPAVIRMVSRATQSDGIVFYTTLMAGLLLALDTAIYLGAALSIILFLRKVAEPEMMEYAFNTEGELTEMKDTKERVAPQISIVHVEGELFFGAAEIFYEQMRRVCDDPNLKVVLLKLRHAHNLDATSVMALEELLKYMKDHDRILLLCEVRKEAVKIFKRSGLLEKVGRDYVFPDNPSNPTLSTARALKFAVSQLGDKSAEVKIFLGGHKRDKPENES